MQRIGSFECGVLPPDIARSARGELGMLSLAKSAVLLCFGALCFSSYATDLYRWVDENGRTHVSDSVPEKYRKSAKKVDSRQSEVSDDQRREAERRAAEERSRAAKMMEEKTQAANQAAPGTAAMPASERAGTSAGNDCAAQHRMYRESLACFAPYVMGNGAVRPEAFERCTSMPDPSFDCGPAPRSD
jgi:hypothetical protein